MPLFSPNALTMGRMMAAVTLYAVISLEALGMPKWCAVVVILLAAISDYADGSIARMRGRISHFGTVFDPIADKLFILSALFLLVANEHPEGLVVLPTLIILWRELLIAGLRQHAALQRIAPASLPLAKLKTCLQYAAISGLFTARSVDDGSSLQSIGVLTLWTASLLTLYTGLVYIRRMDFRS